MDIDKAISVLNKNAPCDHAEGLIDMADHWRCKSCWLDFRKADLESHRMATKVYLAAVSAVRDALKQQQDTLRDGFAMAALQGLLAQSLGTALGSDPAHGARYAYEFADAMMEARNG